MSERSTNPSNGDNDRSENRRSARQQALPDINNLRLPRLVLTETKAVKLKEELTNHIELIIKEALRPKNSSKNLLIHLKTFLAALENVSLSRLQKKRVLNHIDPKAHTSLMHVMARFEIPTYLWAKAVSLGFSPNLKDKDGNTALMIAAGSPHQGASGAAQYFRDKKYDFRAVNNKGQNLFQIAFAAGNLDQAASLLAVSQVLRRVADNQTLRADYGEGIIEMSAREAFDTILGFHGTTAKSSVANELLALIRHNGNLEHALAYVTSYNAMLDPGGHFYGTPFARFLPTIYKSYKHDQMDSILSELEDLMDSDRRLWGHHPNTADIMALLSHPSNEFLHEHNTVARAFTSPYRLWQNKAQHFLPKTVDALKVIGQLGYYALQFKHDAHRPEKYVPDIGVIKAKSLLEVYDFKRGPDTEFGPSYYLKAGSKQIKHFLDYFGITELNPDTSIVFFRGGFLVCNLRGTLFIRNSSLKFGRNIVEEPAYYSKRCFFEPNLSDEKFKAQIKRFTPEWLDKYATHIMKPRFYQKRNRGFEPIYDLTRQLYLVVKDYRFNQADMDPKTARVVDSNGKTRIVGAYRSPNFPALVEYLCRLDLEIKNYNKTDPRFERKMPKLEWVVPRFIPWLSYGELELGELQLRALVNLVNPNEITDMDLLRRSGVYDFLNLGFKKSAALIIKDHDE